MNLKMLKKDFKRKKSMNIILLVFVILATIFISSSLNNLSVVMNGIDDFFDGSKLGDFFILTLREGPDSVSKSEQEVEEFLEKKEKEAEYTKDPCLYVARNNIKLPKSGSVKLGNTILLCNFNMKQQLFYDKNNKVIDQMEDGTIYLPVSFMRDNDLSEGDQIDITTRNGYEKSFRILGSFKDALLGAEMMTCHRYLFSEHDFLEMYQESGLPCGNVYSVLTESVSEFRNDYNKENINVIFSGERKVIKTSYVMDMVLAAILILISLCLIAIAVVMLRFIIIFTVNEDYKEIGIMKAIGIRAADIRKLYLTKYIIIAITGGALGFLLGIPFGHRLVKQVMESIVIENGGNQILLQLFISCLVAGIIILFAYLSTGKIKKFSPMDAIRCGNSGERFKKKGFLRLGKSHMKATTFLAYNDVLNELKKYLALLLTSVVGIWLIVMPINTVNTLSSEGIINWFNMLRCDFYLSDDEAITDLFIKSDQGEYRKYMESLRQTLEENGVQIKKNYMEVIFTYKISKDNIYTNSTAMQGVGTQADQYIYDKGSAPKYENEIALTKYTADEIKASIGDTVYITMFDEKRPFLVTGLFQSMNSRGEGIRFHEDSKIDYAAATGTSGVQFLLNDITKKDDLKNTIQKVKEIFPNALIRTQKEFIVNILGGITDRLASLKTMVLGLVVLINVLVVVLMQRMFLIREQAKIGMMKAIGFSKRSILSWQTKRIMVVLFFGILIGTLTGTPFSQITSGRVFQFMGANKIEFVINPIENYVLYPVIVFVSTVIACMITMRRIRKISIQEMNQMD